MKAPWLKHALIGVSDSTNFNIDGQAGSFVQQVLAQPIEPAQAFAQALGVWAACKRAAFTPEAIDTNSLPELLIVQEEKTLDTKHPAVHTLAEILNSGNLRLMHEALSFLEQTEHKLPSHLLASALDAGRRSSDLRPVLFKAIGARGIWLARLNTAWKYAASNLEEDVGENDPRLWEEGTLAQREIFFKYCRTHSPEHARELLELQFKSMPAKERLTFIEFLEINLSEADEAFLTLQLEDRSRDVKTKAADLLARIPTSAYAKQIIAYIQTLITKEKGFLKESWHCNPPEAFNPEWTKLGLSAEVPTHYGSKGERSWWLLQLISKTPLAWWTQYTGMTPKELMRWAQKTHWANVLQQGWHESIGMNDLEWISLMLELPTNTMLGNYRPHYKLQHLLPKLKASDWEKLIHNLPDNIAGQLQTIELLHNSLPLGQTLPEKLSSTTLTALRRDYLKGSTKENYSMRRTYQEAIGIIAPQALHNWAPLTPRKEMGRAEDEWLTSLEQTISIRKKLYADFSN